jgi:hypothetical protein
VSKPVAVRLADEVAAWVESYAAERGVDPSAILRTAVESFKRDCESGVPEIRELVRRQSVVRVEGRGVGDCSKREGKLGHVWAAPSVDPERGCVHCGLRGRQGVPVGKAVEAAPNYLSSASAARSEFFSRLRVPMQSGTGKAPRSKS